MVPAEESEGDDSEAFPQLAHGRICSGVLGVTRFTRNVLDPALAPVWFQGGDDQLPAPPYAVRIGVARRTTIVPHEHFQERERNRSGPRDLPGVRQSTARRPNAVTLARIDE